MEKFSSHMNKVLSSALEKISKKTFGPIRKVNTEKPLIALTFDDGPHPENTPSLLSILDRYKAHATFFVVGEIASEHPELIKSIMNSGHAIGNHTWDHSSLPTLKIKNIIKQIRNCEKYLPILKQTKLFRPPYGHLNITTCLIAYLWGYTLITWNISGLDWVENDPDVLANNIIEKASPGSIILLHDTIYKSIQKKPLYNRIPMQQAIEIILEKLSNRFHFVTVPVLLQHGKPIKKKYSFELNRFT